jgi:hypothetical protein
MKEHGRIRLDAGVFGPWFRSWRTVAVGLAFLALAAIGFAGTRFARTEMKFARMNPITDVAVAKALSEGRLSGDQLRMVSSMGTEGAAETLYLPPVIVLRIMSAGHESALADLLFVRAHAWFLSHFFSDRRFVWLTNYYDAITGLDPDNPRIYLWAAQVLKLGQMIDDDIINRANGFLRDGLERFPRDWQMHLDLGFNLYFEFKGKNAEEKSLAKLHARDHFATAAGLPGANIDPNFVAELFERDHEDSLAIAYALQKYYEATEDQRNQLLRRISTLSDALADGIRQEEKRWRSGASYIPVALFAILDQREDSMWDILFVDNTSAAPGESAAKTTGGLFN